MKTLPLSRGLFATVDDEDYELVSQWKWHALKNERRGRARIYAARSAWSGGSRSYIYLHRFIMQPGQGQQVDHIDNDSLNNMRSNLRICTHAENVRNVPRKCKNNSGYTGVAFRKDTGKYVAQISIDGRMRFFGCYEKASDAARIRDIAALVWHKKFAVLNFPNESLSG